jgi:hypothetical protein
MTILFNFLKEGQLGVGDFAYRFSVVPILNITSGVTKISCGIDSSSILHSNYTCFGKQSSVAVQCSGNGLCISNDQCSCQSNFYGNECQFTTCFGINSTSNKACSGNGNCTDLDTCICNTNFGGIRCQFDYNDDPQVLYTTGQNVYGELGDGTFTNSLVLRNISLKGIKNIYAGIYQSAVLRNDSTLFTFGINEVDENFSHKSSMGWVMVKKSTEILQLQFQRIIMILLMYLLDSVI